jgi:hypothetical protein
MGDFFKPCPSSKMGELLKTLQGLDDWVKNGGLLVPNG